MYSLLAFGMPGTTELIVILIVALLIFGPRLPKIMRGLGSSVREFRGGMDESEDEKAKPATASESDKLPH